MTTHNNITGDAIRSKPTTEAYRDGHERIFGDKPKPEDPKDEQDEREED